MSVWAVAAVNSSTDVGLRPERSRQQNGAMIEARRANLLDFGSFYQDHRDSVGRALALTLGDADLGFEAADEAMVRACQRWGEVAGYANPAGWVYRAGLNWARSFLRKRKRSRDKAPLVATLAESRDTHIDLDVIAALDHLSDDHRAVIVLRFFQDYSVEETAQVLDIPIGTVKSRSNRAFETLNRHLARSHSRTAGDPGIDPVSDRNYFRIGHSGASTRKHQTTTDKSTKEA